MSNEKGLRLKNQICAHATSILSRQSVRPILALEALRENSIGAICAFLRRTSSKVKLLPKQFADHGTASPNDTKQYTTK
jgi:hypothetical protein